MAKREVDYDLIVAFLLGGFGVTFLLGAGIAAELGAKENKKTRTNTKFTIISAENGEIYRLDDSTNNDDFNVRSYNPEYKIISQTDNSLTIFVYCENPADRILYADYIETNININKDNVVYFNEELISNEGYKEYINSIEEYQRKRV